MSFIIEAANSPFVVAATPAAIALIGVLLSNRRTRQEVRHRVGTPNGQGNLVEMSERMLDRLDDLEVNYERLDDKVNRALSRLGRIEKKQRHQEQTQAETLDRVCRLEGGADHG